MPSSEARVPTDKASRYLGQLCKHFAQKVPAQCGGTNGKVEFEPGTCLMEVVGDELVLRCKAEEPGGLQTVKDVVRDHLVRFGWREELTVEWRDRP